jgi:tetratricopeptide (TPR) repeat protein
MKSNGIALLVVGLAAAGAAGAIAANLAAPSPAPVEAAEPDLSRLEESLARLAREQQALATALEELRADIAMRPAPEARVQAEDAGALDAAVARWMEKRGDGEGKAAGKDTGQPAEETLDEISLDAAIAKLLDPKLDDAARQKLWKEYADRGLTDALVAEFEARVERDPTNPDLRVELGGAYLQKIFELGTSGPMTGVWATKADKAFDSALELDPQHWDARFDKAVSLSFWPPIFGKQKEAIHHFEKLIEQQAAQAQQPKFASTHLLLGNMYQQAGDMGKAVAAWNAGLSLFPGNEALKKQIALAQ